MSDIFQIPAILKSYSSKSNGAVKFTFTTVEKVPASMLSTIMSFIDNAGYLNFAVRKIEADDIAGLPKIDPSKYDQAKSPGERLRAVIYRYWEQKGKEGDFNIYYMKAMERMIDSYKERLT